MIGHTFTDGDTKRRADDAKRRVHETTRGWHDSRDQAFVEGHIADLKLLVRVNEEHLGNLRRGRTS